MSNTTSNDTPAVAEETRARVYDAATPAAAKQSGPGVYDAPARASGLPLGMIVGIVVALVIVAFLLFQFVF
jgi:hypothetical protein